MASRTRPWTLICFLDLNLMCNQVHVDKRGSEMARRTRLQIRSPLALDLNVFFLFQFDVNSC